MWSVIPRAGVSRGKRRGYIEMYAKPQRAVFGGRGYITPKAVLGSGGIRGGFVSIGERKVEAEVRESTKVVARGDAVKVEKRDYKMPPVPSIVGEIKRRMDEEEKRRAETEKVDLFSVGRENGEEIELPSREWTEEEYRARDERLAAADAAGVVLPSVEPQTEECGGSRKERRRKRKHKQEF